MPKLETPMDVLREILVYPEGRTSDALAERAVGILKGLEIYQLRDTQECIQSLWMATELSIREKTAEQ